MHIGYLAKPKETVVADRTLASDIVRQDNSIIPAFKVQKRLDLEDMRTGFNYLQRFAKDIINREAKLRDAISNEEGRT